MNRQQSKNKRRELAKKYDLTPEQVELIVKSQFEFVAMTIRSADRQKKDFKTVLLARFGRFAPSMARLQKIDEIKQRKNGTASDIRIKTDSVSVRVDNQ